MNKACIKFNSKITIIHRQGQFFSCGISGELPLVSLNEVDVILLNYFFVPRDHNDIVDFLSVNSIIHLISKTITLNELHRRIDFYVKNNILIPCHKEEALIKEASLKLESAQVIDVLNKKLKLGANFSLIIGEQGFQMWSVRAREYYYIPEKILLILILYKSGNKLVELQPSFEKVIDFEKADYYVNWLYEKGMLIDASLPEGGGTKKNISDISLMPTYKSQSHMLDWEKLSVDNRIPVYFVPHMQNHFPLALGMLFSAIKAFNYGALLKKYILIPITYLPPEEFLNGPYKKFGRGVWLFSNYMWSMETNIKISDIIKKHDVNNITIHGGPSTPNYKQKSIEFFENNSSVDITVHGEGETAISNILECINDNRANQENYNLELLKDVTGITFRIFENNLHRTNDRKRMENLDVIPSPYNEGYFNTYSEQKVDAAIVESNRGCPFGCTFCDWGSATNQKIRKFELDRVKQEIEWIAQKGVKVLWIADANFGLYDRDIELSQFIVELKLKYSYPQEVVVNYTKNTTWRLAEIIKIFSKGNIVSQGIISIQTTDVVTLEVIKRKNIKTQKYDELSQIFRDLNLPLSTDLMLGLPGITVEAFKKDLQRYFDQDVSVKAYPTQLLPNSPMADPEYIEQYKIEVDENDFLISSYSFTENDLLLMKDLYKVFTLFDGYSILRYVLRYLQWDYNVGALDFLCCLLNELKKEKTLYPRIKFVFLFFENEKILPGGWKCFYDEIALFVKQYYSIERTASFDSILKVNECVMPDDSNKYPLIIKLEHDVEKYFLANIGSKELDEENKLENYTNSLFEVDDPYNVSQIDSDNLQYDTHQYFWELRSKVARATSPL